MTDAPIPLLKVFMAETVKDAVVRVLYSGYIGEGEEVRSFESELAAHVGTTRILTTNAATSALHLAYHMAVDGAPDAEIITTPITCSATNTPIVHSGARIVWADVDPISGSIDPAEIEALITPRTRAIVMVHWGGNPCDIARISRIGETHGIKIIEDAAHAFGSTYQGLPIGRHSDFVVFSFQAIKHVTSVDGGAIICKDPKHYERARLLRWYGIDRTSHQATDMRCELDIEEAGYKFHMNNVSAAIGRENLKHARSIIERHRDNARFYDAAFRGAGAVRIVEGNPDGTSAAWLYTIHVANRDELMRQLLAMGIGASKVHARNDRHSAFASARRDLPNADSFDRTHLCIPVGWWLSHADRERVAEAVLRLAR
jgi:dTDP-4-amino-4,6-dideoxygalactose transaminase